MTASRTVRVTAPTGNGSDQSGTSLPELLVAGSLSLVALGMVVATVVAPLHAVSQTGTVDEGRARLDLASEQVVKIVRGAHPTLEGPALVAVGPDQLTLRIGGIGAHRTTTLALRDRSLTVETTGAAHSQPQTVPDGVLIDGLDPERSAIRARSGAGSDIAPDTLSEALLVEVRLHADGHEVVRRIRLRMER